MVTIPSYLFPLTFFSLLAIERFLPGRPLPRVSGWTLKGSAWFLLLAPVNFGVPPLVAHLIGSPSGRLGALGQVGGAAVLLLATTFALYWWHRGLHRFDAVWRWTHQLHHSAERVDIAGFAYVHPIEFAANTAISALVATALGATRDIAMLSAYAAFLLGLFPHLNLRTPRWIGSLAQRPEQHAVHHQRGVHAYNYGLPLWDLLFGTFRNPPGFSETAGFWDGASSRVGAMLIGRDVSDPPAPGGARHSPGGAV